MGITKLPESSSLTNLVTHNSKVVGSVIDEDSHGFLQQLLLTLGKLNFHMSLITETNPTGNELEE